MTHFTVRTFLVGATFLIFPSPEPGFANSRDCWRKDITVEARYRGCTKAIQLGQRQGRKKLARAYLNRAWLVRKQNVEQAIADLNKSISLDGKNFRALFIRGRIFMSNGNQQSAIDDFTSVIELDPNNIAAFFNRALLYRRAKDTENALSDFTRVIQLNPEDTAAHFNRAVLHTTMGDYTKALSDYTRAIELEPDNSRAYSNRADLYARMADYGRALIDYDKAIDLQPKNVRAVHGKALALTSLGKLNSALSAINHVIELDDTLSSPYRTRGLVYAQKKELKLARLDFERALELDPGSLYARYLLGLVSLEEGKIDDTISDLSFVIENGFDEPRAYFYRGVALTKKRQLSSAKLDLDRFVQLVPSDNAGLEWRGKIYVMLGHEKLPSPSASISASNVHGQATTSEQVTIHARVKINEGGIGRITWQINGVTQGISSTTHHGARGLSRDSPDGSSFNISYKLPLAIGDNDVKLLVHNAANKLTSPPSTLSITRLANKVTPDLHVLAIGVNDYYDSRLRLNYAASDAKSIASAIRRSGEEFYNAVSITVLTDEMVTARGLEKAFDALSREAKPNDVFIFYAAGHGRTLEKEFFFLPWDFRYHTEQSIRESGIGIATWQTWFARVAARKSILIFDSCESGSLTSLEMPQHDVSSRSTPDIQEAVGRLIRATGRTILTASTSNEPALEGYKGHGILTYALIEGLSKADGNSNGLIELTEWAGYADSQVPAITKEVFGYRQLPQMRIEGSNFAFGKKQ